MKHIFTCLAALLMALPSVARAAAELIVYPPVPGLAASEHYKVRVRPASDGSAWQSAFAWETVCKTVEKKTDAYFEHLAGWTHTYVNFETAGAVEIEIARVNGQPIRAAAVHPQRKASACSVKDGKVIVRLDQPCLVAVDIDGQMDGQDTGKGYKGPPIHTISLFANPALREKLETARQIVRPESWQRAPAAKTQADIFEIEGNKAHVYAAPKPAKGKPWIWYAPIVKGDVIIVKHKMYFDAFMKAGIAIAGFDLDEVRGAPGSTAKFTPFYDAMVQRGYSPKPILLGQSRGGLMTLAWAFRNPGKVQAWAGIYPVCNLASYPLKSSKKETLADFAMTEEALLAKLSEFNPINNLAALAAQKVPMFSVHGDKDGTVPYDDNTKLLKERYEAAGGTCSVKIIPGGGHEISPSFFECQELIEFVLKHARGD